MFVLQMRSEKKPLKTLSCLLIFCSGLLQKIYWDHPPFILGFYLLLLHFHLSSYFCGSFSFCPSHCAWPRCAGINQFLYLSAGDHHHQSPVMPAIIADPATVLDWFNLTERNYPSNQNHYFRRKAAAHRQTTAAALQDPWLTSQKPIITITTTRRTKVQR